MSHSDRAARWALPTALAALAISLGTAVQVVTREAPSAQVLNPSVASDGPKGHSYLALPVQIEPDSAYPNRMVSLTSNWEWSDADGWTRPAPYEPSVALTMEPWFHGLSELNFDMQPPAGSLWPGGRALGLAARQDGSYATLFMGGAPYNPGSSGIKITGGLTAEAVIAVQESPTSDAILRVVRPDQQTGIRLLGGPTPSLSMGLGGESADRLGSGVVRSLGPLGAHAFLSIVGPGEESTILSVRERVEDEPRLTIRADGRIEWSEGAATPVWLTASNGELATQGTLAPASLRVGDGSVVRSIRLVSIDIAPEPVAAGSARAQSFDAWGIAHGNLVFASGPAQPAGVAMGQARADGDNRVALDFTNLGRTIARPAAGRYTFLVVDGDSAER